MASLVVLRLFREWDGVCVCVCVSEYVCVCVSTPTPSVVHTPVHARSAGALALLLSALTLLAMAPFVYMELCTIYAYGLGWLQPWNVADFVSYIIQVAIVVLHAQRSVVDEGWFSVLLALQHVLLWAKLHYFAKARQCMWCSVCGGPVHTTCSAALRIFSIVSLKAIKYDST